MMLSLSKNAVLGGVLGDLTRRSRSVEEGRSCRQARPLGRFRATFACNLAAPSTLDPAETRGQTTRPEFYTIILTGGDAVCQRISGTGNANPNLRRSHPGQALLTSRTGNAHIQDRRCQTQIDCNACPRNAPSAMPVPGIRWVTLPVLAILEAEPTRRNWERSVNYWIRRGRVGPPPKSLAAGDLGFFSPRDPLHWGYERMSCTVRSAAGRRSGIG